MARPVRVRAPAAVPVASKPKGGAGHRANRNAQDSEPPFAIERKDKRVPSQKVMDKWQTGTYDPYPMQVKRNNFMHPGSGSKGQGA